MREAPAETGGARDVLNQPKRKFIPPETVASMSSAGRRLAIEEIDDVVETMNGPEWTAAL
jgi:hypothetical protein